MQSRTNPNVNARARCSDQSVTRVPSIMVDVILLSRVMAIAGTRIVPERDLK
jgi:hypothetical protein